MTKDEWDKVDEDIRILEAGIEKIDLREQNNWQPTDMLKAVRELFRAEIQALLDERTKAAALNALLILSDNEGDALVRVKLGTYTTDQVVAIAKALLA